MTGLEDRLEDFRSPAHTRHSPVRMVRQRVCRMAAGHEHCTGADVYKCFEGEKVTHFTRILVNVILNKLGWPALGRPSVSSQVGGQVNVFDFRYQAKSWDQPRRAVCKVEWQAAELFPKVGYIVTCPTLPP